MLQGDQCIPDPIVESTESTPEGQQTVEVARVDLFNKNREGTQILAQVNRSQGSNEMMQQL